MQKVPAINPLWMLTMPRLELLPRLAMVGLDLQSRQQALAFGSDGRLRMLRPQPFNLV